MDIGFFKTFKTVDEMVDHNMTIIHKLKCAGHIDFAQALQEVTDLQVSAARGSKLKQLVMAPINFARGCKAGYKLGKARAAAIQSEGLMASISKTLSKFPNLSNN